MKRIKGNICRMVWSLCYFAIGYYNYTVYVDIDFIKDFIYNNECKSIKLYICIR